MRPEDVIGVLVTYQPDEAVSERIQGHLKQLSQIVVIDNGADKPAAVLPKDKGIKLLAHSDNNLAAAQNVGIRRARENGAKAILLLDDDSELSDGALEALCEAYEDGHGLIAPQLMEDERVSPQAAPWLGVLFRRHIAPIENSFTPIASGSVIAMQVLEEVGLMDESLNIDYVDRDFCLRLMQRGYRPNVIADAQLHHRLGVSELQGRIKVRNHSPERRRTIFRNRLRCWARYGLSVPSFVLYDAMAMLYDLFRIVVFEESKRAKLAAAGLGALDAVLGRRG